jgi:hypothetical protein
MSSTAPVPTEESERPEPPFSPALVEELLRQLDKTVRAHQLYNHNNPTYLRALEALRASFAPIWSAAESITLSVADLKFIWFGVSVHEQHERASDSLPWTLYKDGLRELTLTAGFEGEELELLLDIIPRVRKAVTHEDDLITLLWEQDFAHLTYRYVEAAADTGAPIDPAAQPGRWPAEGGANFEDPRAAIEEARHADDAGTQAGAKGPPASGGGEEAKPSPSGIVKMEDFDSTLYFLDANEVAYLRSETEREYATDLRRSVLSALLDVFELQTDKAVRAEVVQDLDALTLHLLAGRQFSSVAFLLREIDAVLERARDLSPDLKSRLASLPDRLSEPAALSQLLEAMDEAVTLPPRADLEELFAQLRASALGTVFGWLGSMQNAKLRPLLEGAADRLAQSNTGDLVKLIASAERNVAMEAVRRAGGLKTAAAVPALGKVLSEPHRDLRLTAVAALVEIGTPGAMQALEKALDDAERDVRVAAIKALAQKAYKPALAKVSSLVKANHIREVDRTERLAAFELYGTLCGDSGVVWLDELLNPKSGLFSRKEDPEVRACAAIALGHIGTVRSQNALQKAMAEKDAVVRNAVNRALKGGAA